MNSVKGLDAWSSRTRAAVAAVVAVLLGWLVVVSTPPRLGGAPLAGSHTSFDRSLLRVRFYQTLPPGKWPTAGDLRFAREVALRAPLAFEPLLIAARDAQRSGDVEKAIVLAEEARRRRTNFVPTRALLMEYYGRTGRAANMFVEMDAVLGLNNAAREYLLPELVKLIHTPAGREALAAELADRPAWRDDFFRLALNQSFTPQEAGDLFDQARSQRPRGDHSFERELFARALVAAGQVRRARAVWLEGLPQAQRARVGDLFDGGFTGASAPPPFGWTLYRSDLGRAEMESLDGERPILEVDYFGGRPFVLAEQVLALAPGRYQLRYLARGDAAAESGTIAWQITCLPERRTIARSETGNLSEQYRTITTAFTIPGSGCNGQQLNLVGEPGDLSRQVSVEFAALEVAR